MNKWCTTKLTRSVLLVLLGAVTGSFSVNADSSVEQIGSLPYYGSADFTPHWFEADENVRPTFHRIPDFSFTNQDGEVVTEREVAEGVYVASFFFSTCPGICPMIRSRLSNVQDRFLEDERVKILSHSIRPKTDTVQVLQSYAKSNGVVSGKWHLLTGERDVIYSLARQAYFADEDLGNPDSIESFLHTENLLLIDHNRRIRGVYNGRSQSSVSALIADIEALLNP